MLLPDVNVCVHAIAPHVSDEAERVREWLDRALVGHEAVGFSELVLSAMIRISTSPRVFVKPASPLQAVGFAEAMLAAPAAGVVRPGPRHWQVFSGLVTTNRLRGSDVPDAYLAGIAMEAGAHLATLDRGFRRFDGLRTVNPLDL
jgi:toxin-antitoxin system PIN domain toxin